MTIVFESASRTEMLYLVTSEDQILQYESSARRVTFKSKVSLACRINLRISWLTTVVHCCSDSHAHKDRDLCKEKITVWQFCKVKTSEIQSQGKDELRQDKSRTSDLPVSSKCSILQVCFSTVFRFQYF